MISSKWFKDLFFNIPKEEPQQMLISQKYPNLNLTIDKKGFDFIKNWEKFESKPYKCPAGKMTIGFGHVILDKETFDLEGISLSKAEELLRVDIAKRTHWTNSNITKPLTQNQFNALISIAFNSTNDGDLIKVAPTAIGFLNLGEYDKAAIELFSKEKGLVFITTKDKATGERRKSLVQGLVNRRKAEWDMWNDRVFVS